MGASFRNVSQITELAGCDLLTISPDLLKNLQDSTAQLTRKLDPAQAASDNVGKIDLDEKTFRWMLNEDAMATDKLADGIRKFAADIVQLEKIIAQSF
jgi:transaldolase